MQDMLRSWSEPFREAHGQRLDVRWYELSLVESAVSPSFQILQCTKHLPLGRMRGYASGRGFSAAPLKAL